MNLKIVTIQGHIFINASQDLAAEYLRKMQTSVDLIVADPDYKDIGKLLNSGLYENLRGILKNNHPLLHYTHNCSPNGTNCIEAMPYRLHDEMKKKGFRYRLQLFWQKYRGQKLNLSKISRQKTSPPNDTDLLMIFMKGKLAMPTYTDLRVFDRNGIKSNVLAYQADQTSQFKPVDLCRDIILAFSQTGSVVLDTHAGGGNLAIEAIKTGRKYIGIESNTQLFDKLVYTVKKMLNQDIPTVPVQSNRHKWTAEEIAIIRENKHLPARLIKSLHFKDPSITMKAVQRKKDLLRGENLQRNGSKVETWEINYMMEHPDMSNKELMSVLHRRPDELDKIRHQIKKLRTILT